MKTVQQWIDEYLSPEERERFVRNANDPELNGLGLNRMVKTFRNCVVTSFIFPDSEMHDWYKIAKRTEPYNPQRPVIGSPLNFND